MPVQITGWKTLPAAGEEVYEIESEVGEEYDSNYWNLIVLINRIWLIVLLLNVKQMKQLRECKLMQLL